MTNDSRFLDELRRGTGTTRKRRFRGIGRTLEQLRDLRLRGSSRRPRRSAVAALLSLILGALPTAAHLGVTTGALALMAYAAPASAQETLCIFGDAGEILCQRDNSISCDYIRPLDDGTFECLIEGAGSDLTLTEIVLPDVPFWPPPDICRTASGDTPTSVADCTSTLPVLSLENLQFKPGPELVIAGCSDAAIFTTECVRPEDLELASDPDYVPPLFVPELAALTDTLTALEDQAVQDVLALHQLPETDADKVLGYARNDVRAMLFSRLVDMAALDPAERTDEQQSLVDAFAESIRDRRVLAAELARLEYDEWKSNPCLYNPPGDYTYDPIECRTAPNLGSLFELVAPPSSEDFQAYGAARAFDFMTDPELGLPVVVDTAYAVRRNATDATLNALRDAGIASVVATAIAGAVFTAVLAFAKPIFPLAVWVNAGTLASVAVTGAAGAFASVFVAIFIAVLQGIAVFTAEAIPGELDRGITEARQPVNLTQLVQTGNEGGLQEYFAAFIASTLPDRPGNGPAPAATVHDPLFRITDAQGNNAVFGPQIDFLSWDDSGQWDARLSGGWFVVNGVVETDSGDQSFERLSLKILYEGWDGSNWTAWRVGERFLHLRDGSDSDPQNPEDSFLSDEIHFVDASGIQRIATVVIDATPPVIESQVAGTLGDNGWYTSNVSLSWDVSDPESEIKSTTGCGTEQITTDVTAFVRTCTAASEGGESSETVTIKRDATAPTIAYTLTPAPNANGWNKSSPVTVQFQCTDSGSGVAFCTQNGTAAGDGSWPWQGEVRDDAGNTSDIDFSVNIDTTAPIITGTASPSANTAGWNNTDVTVSFACDDPMSGISSCTSPQTLSAEGGSQQVEGTAVDRADNTSSTTVAGINIDKTPPAVTITTPADGATYVQNQVVLAQWSATDALSGIGEASGSAANGAAVDTASAGAQTFTVAASDVAGNISELSHGYTVLSAAEATAAFVAEVEAVVTQAGLESSLTSKLDNALSSLQRGNQAAAQGQIGAFINEVQAQRGKQIAAADADDLIAYAQLILGAM